MSACGTFNRFIMGFLGDFSEGIELAIVVSLNCTSPVVFCVDTNKLYGCRCPLVLPEASGQFSVFSISFQRLTVASLT